MPNIHVLDKAVAELIAAGEVVERPSSIAKELIENAIDAGATAVTVEIAGGGVECLCVGDNGSGIPREEVPTAFIRHATSKVRSAGDLDAILTLGFRGEALPSIASVSKVELTTRTEGETEGTLCRLEGGALLGVEPVGSPVGTVIMVRDLFYNTPARMKFLRTDTGEGNSVALAVEKCALSHPEIAFRFIRDGVTKLTTSGSGDLLAVLRAVYGKELAASMVAVDYEYEGKLRVHGYLSRPEGAKAGRTYQNFFINNRYVKTRTASAALEEAFKTKLAGGKYPACALFLDMNPAAVDVNVHPAKLEVRFADEKPVFHAVYFAAKSALAGSPVPVVPAPPPSPAQPAKAAIPPASRPRMSASEFQAAFGGAGSAGGGFSRAVALGSGSSLDIEVDGPVLSPPPRVPTPATAGLPALSRAGADKNFAGSETRTPESDTTIVETLDKAPDARLIGEAFGVYMLVERGDELLLVDKHAAHERIRYEALTSARQGASPGGQVLLSPLAIHLSREDYGAITEEPERLTALGFTVDDFGDGAVLVREIPMELGERDVELILGEIAEKLRTGSRDLTPEVIDRLTYSIACKSAVRAGDKSSQEELRAILKTLAENPEITHCPHGRPVTVRLRRAELEKRFGRLG